MANNPPKILIVDDEPQIRTLLKATLARAGYRVVEAANAPRGPERQGDRPARPDPPRSWPSRPRRAGAGRGAARRSGQPRDHLVGARANRAESRGARPRRGRLCHQAVRHRGTARPRPRLACVRNWRRSRAATGRSRRRRDRSLDRLVLRDGAEVHLTPKEWAVLAELANRPGRVLTHAICCAAPGGRPRNGRPNISASWFARCGKS